jgi:CheY-like chemotaxis protein
VRQAAILLVEDNALIRMMIVAMVKELGHRVVAQAGTLDEARRLAETAEFDIALLDINLHDQSVAPVAEIIEKRGLPFLFVTAYGTSGLPEPFRKKPLLSKPFAVSKLGAFIEEMLDDTDPSAPIVSQ